MKKLFYFLIILSFKSHFAFAQDASKTEAGSDSVPCKDCSSSSEAKDLLNALNSSFKHEEKADKDKEYNQNNKDLIDWLKQKADEYPASCKEFFLDKIGNLGKFSKITGSLIAEDVEKYGDNSLFVKSNPDFDRLCPNFNKFTTRQKVAFHGWIFELLAFPESSCNVNVKPNTAAPTTKAVCLYQLEDKPEIRKWRGAKFDVNHCSVSYDKILTLEGCTGCAFDEYKRKTTKDSTPFGIVDPNTGKKISGAYWASFNPLGNTDNACYEKYLDPNGKPMTAGGKPLFLSKCVGANWEWIPRNKFFKRIQRFPLCGTESAKKELESLNAWRAAHTATPQ